VNILIAGRTGVGKSTLINAVFQGNFATTGQGRPVTQSTREIKKEGIPLSKPALLASRLLVRSPQLLQCQVRWLVLRRGCDR